MTNYNEFITKYTQAGVDGLVLVHEIDNTVYFRYVPLITITDDVFYAITQGKDCFKAVKRNQKFLENQISIKEMSLDDFNSVDGSNRGYKAEMVLFGKVDTTDSLIDGVFNGYKVQVKCSINGSSTNKF